MSEEIKRYDSPLYSMNENNDGDYVSYDDYAPFVQLSRRRTVALIVLTQFPVKLAGH